MIEQGLGLHYQVDIRDFTFPPHSVMLDFESQIHFPDGKVLRTRMQDNLDRFHVYENPDIIADTMAEIMSTELIEALRKDIRDSIKEKICQRLIQVGRKYI